VAKRLFIAVDIDQATRDQVGAISRRLRDAIGTVQASWVRADRMHLTLHFLGQADAALEERVRDALAAPIDVAPFDVSFDGIGIFPSHGSPRVLWLGVAAGLERLRRLYAGFAGRGLTHALPKRSGDPFTPHLTLARIRDRAPRPKIGEITRIPASAGPSRIDRVTLYESRLSPAGPTYVPLAEALLPRSG
jgi:RNA 2',3'-cyclic 3'-phosphodiesterase